MQQAQQVEGVVWIPLGQIMAFKQDRQNFNEPKLIRLAGSICKKGQQTPITLRPAMLVCHGCGKVVKAEEGHQCPDHLPPIQYYELVAGERRTRACRIATEKVQAGEWKMGDKFRPGFIQATVEEMNDEERLEIMGLENLARENLNPMEESDAYQERLNRGKTEQDLAETFGQTARHIREMVRLQRLCPEVQDLLRTGQIELALAMMMVGGVDKEPLDHNRQKIVLKFLAKAGGKAPVLLFGSFVAELRQAQADEGQLDFMADFWADQAAAPSGEKFLTKGPRIVFPFAVDERLPEPAYDGRGTNGVGKVMFDWIGRLEAEGFTAEAAVVARLCRYCVRSSLTELPRPSALDAWEWGQQKEGITT